MIQVGATKSEYDKRMKICKACPHFQKNIKRCKECGCLIIFKAMFKDLSCPMKKW